MSILLVSVSVLAILFIMIVFVLAMCRAASVADTAIERALYFDHLRKDMQADAIRLAAMPQGIPTDDMLNDMAIAMEEKTLLECVKCEYKDTCHACHFDTVCPHTLTFGLPVHTDAPVPCDRCPYGPLESTACMEHECCPPSVVSCYS